MKILLRFLVFAAGLLPAATFAQAPVPDTAQVLKNEVGLVAMSLPGKSFARAPFLPVGLVYKRHFLLNQALRICFLGAYDRQDSTAVDLDTHRTQTQQLISSLVGYEWRYQATKWCAIHYGLDFGLQWQLDQIHTQEPRSKVPPETSNYVFYRHQDNTTKTWQCRPFTGVTIFLGKRWRLTMESAVVGMYGKTHYKNRAGEVADDNPDRTLHYHIFGDFNSAFRRLAFRPFQSFGLLFLL